MTENATGQAVQSGALLDEIGTHIEAWTQLADIEDSPLGGNVVKAATYRGTATGLKIAEQIIIEHTSNRCSADSRINQ